VVAAFSNNPERAVPSIGADRESMASECELSPDILSRPKEFAPLYEGNTGDIFNTTTECPESHCRDSEADTLIVLLRVHG
jgi:hypothetical protein